MADSLSSAGSLEGGALALGRALYRALRSGRWLNRARIVGLGLILLSLDLTGSFLMAAATHGWFAPSDVRQTTDFASFYAAGVLANAGTPELAYDPVRHFAVEQQVTGGLNYQFFYYPPTFLLLCSLLTRLPYLVAFAVFEAVTLALYLVVARRILGDRSPGATLLLLAFPAVYWTIGLGQNALLTAALFGAATLLVDRRPVLAGLLWGALCYKPHVGLLIPVALAAGGRWRSFLAAATGATALLLLSLALFGAEAWLAYLRALSGAGSTYDSGRISLFAMVNPSGAVRLLGGSPALAHGVQLAAIAAAVLLVAVIWRRRLSLPSRAATLAAASLVAMPVVLVYDMMLAALAIAWLVRQARETGFLPWEKAAFMAVFAAAYLSLPLSGPLHFPIALASLLALLAIILQRARWELARARAPG